MTGRGPGRLLGLAFVTFALAAGAPATHASQYFKTDPELTRDERRAYSVGAAHAICEAELLEFVAAGKWIGEGAGRGWYPEPQLLIRPVRWFKGSGGSGPVRVRISDERLERYREPNFFRQPPRRALVFLAGRLSPKGDRYDEVQGWWLMDGAYTLDDGIVDVSDSLGGRELAQFDRELELQSPAALARASDLVVLAHPVAGSLMRDHFQLFYDVDSVLIGATEFPVLDVKGRVPSDLASGPSLLFLRHDQGNAFTIVRTGAGSCEVRDGVARGFMRSLADVLAQVRASGHGAREKRR